MLTYMLDAHLEAEDYCYVTTTGRVTGREHTIEIWFAAHGSAIHILAGGRHSADWVKNVLRRPDVRVRIDGATFAGRARIVDDAAEDALARRLVLAKYSPRNSDLDEWGGTALPVAIDLEARE
jgi:deazaflavin-dependent oxidoreductase (nitroreductase family)